MAPIKSFECLDCGTKYDSLIRSAEDEAAIECPTCMSKSHQGVMTFAANYTIKGNNSASTRPKRSK